MKAITCPNCGSGSVQQLTEEKYFCNGCEQIFMLHNLSKEFQQTDEHISSMHSDLKREIGQMAENSANSEYNSLVESAEYYMRAGDYQKAYEFFTEIAGKYPQYSAGWYGRYRALTKGFTEFKRDDIVYGYVEENGERQGFAGWEDVRNVLLCADADRENITAEVTQYVRKCAEQTKQAAENCLRENGEKYAAVKRRQEEICPKQRKKVLGGSLLGALPGLFVVLLLVVLVTCILEAYEEEDLVSMIIGVVLIILALRFGGPRLIKSFYYLFGLLEVNSEGEKGALKQAASEILGEEYDTVKEDDSGSNGISRDYDYRVNRYNTLCSLLIDSCVHLDICNLLLSRTENPDSFIRTYTTDPFGGFLLWQNEPEFAVSVADFAANLMAGQLERFRYLLDGILVVPPAGKNVSRAAAPAGGVSRPSMTVPTGGAPQSGRAAAGGIGALMGSVEQGMESGLRGFKESMNGKGMRSSQGAQDAQAQRLCPNCGASLDADDVFCGNCGARIG